MNRRTCRDFYMAVVVNEQNGENPWIPFESLYYFPDEKANAEELMIKQEHYDNLSNEAKRIIRIIINSPQEILEAIAATPKYKLWSAERVVDYFGNKWSSRKKAERAVGEIKKFVRTCL